MTEKNKDYARYYQFESTGGWCAVMTCLRCGAAVLAENATSKDGKRITATSIHDDWHKKLEAKGRFKYTKYDDRQ